MGHHKAHKHKSLLKALYTFGNCQRPVSSLGVSHYNHKITNLWKFGLDWSSKLWEKDERKNTLVGRICVLSDKNKRLLARSLLLFIMINYLKNSSPMLVTKSVFKLILVLSNYQTCTFPLSGSLFLERPVTVWFKTWMKRLLQFAAGKIKSN